MQLPVSAAAVRAEFKKAAPARPARPHDEEADAAGTPEAPEQVEPSEREFWLLHFVLNADEQMDWLWGHLDIEWVQHPTVRTIIDKRLQAHHDNRWHGIPGFVSAEEDPFAQRLITEAVAEPPGAEIERKLADTVRMLRNTFIDRRLAALTAQLAQPGLTGEQFTQIETEKTYLRRWKAEPLRPKADT